MIRLARLPVPDPTELQRLVQNSREPTVKIDMVGNLLPPFRHLVIN